MWLCLTCGTVMPNDWLPTVLRFRADERTFAEFTREIREEKKAN